MKIVRNLALSVVFVLGAAGLSVVTARALLLPGTACAVSSAKAFSLKLERPYATVRDEIGCEGVLISRDELAPGILREVYAWRGDGWPYGRLEGVFYNGVLHGTDVRWLTLNLGETGAADASQSELHLDP